MICIIGSETTQNYGLFNDLLHSPDFLIVYCKPPFWSETLAWRALRRLWPKFPRLYEKCRAWHRSILKRLDRIDRIVVIDTALRHLDLCFLDNYKGKKPSLRIDCFLLNSIGSMAYSENSIHSKVESYCWDTIMTFDPHDADRNNWIYTGLCNYSKHKLPAAHKLSKPQFDIVYAGSIMGPRGKKLLNLLNYFNANDVNCQFICPVFRNLCFESGVPKGLQLLPKRISYQKVLEKTIGANCILEVLQDGQAGASLRYCEAVCYNKKLLTTNTEITNYPFYNSRYMKVFSDCSDIDLEWVRKVESVDYGYRDEFSPIHLFDASLSAGKQREKQRILS